MLMRCFSARHLLRASLAAALLVAAACGGNAHSAAPSVPRQAATPSTARPHTASESDNDGPPIKYDSFSAPFGADTVPMSSADLGQLKFGGVLPSSLGDPTLLARDSHADVAAFIFKASSNGTFKITETAAAGVTQSDLDSYLNVHPPSVSVAAVSLSQGNAVIEYNDGYVEVTILVNGTLVKVFGPTSNFSQQQGAAVAKAFAAARAG